MSLRSANSRCEEGSGGEEEGVGVGRVNSQMSGTFIQSQLRWKEKPRAKGRTTKQGNPHGQNGGTSDQIKTD